jgi:hypothetical protein
MDILLEQGREVAANCFQYVKGETRRGGERKTLLLRCLKMLPTIRHEKPSCETEQS